MEIQESLSFMTRKTKRQGREKAHQAQLIKLMTMVTIQGILGCGFFPSLAMYLDVNQNAQFLSDMERVALLSDAFSPTEGLQAFFFLFF
jgi:hypothetical protein